MTDSVSFEVAADRRVRVTTATRASLLDDVDLRLASRRGFSVATLNLDHLVKLRRCETFRRAYDEHSHVVADGNPIVWVSHLAGRPVELVPGCELVAPICGMAARLGAPVALLGATDDTLARAGAALTTEWPSLNIVARIAPAYGFDPEGAEADACIEALRLSGARLCFLALGAPKQEVFAARAQAALPETGFVSVGAGLDFIAGVHQRAPCWMRRLAMEWLWRAASDPARLVERYVRCAALLPGLAIGALIERQAPQADVRPADSVHHAGE